MGYHKVLDTSVIGVNPFKSRLLGLTLANRGVGGKPYIAQDVFRNIKGGGEVKEVVSPKIVLIRAQCPNKQTNLL